MYLLEIMLIHLTLVLYTCNVLLATYHLLTADQHPRKFFDQRDAGLYICRWPNGKVPSNALLYTSEVTYY